MQRYAPHLECASQGLVAQQAQLVQEYQQHEHIGQQEAFQAIFASERRDW